MTDAPLGSVRATPALRFQAGQFSTVLIGSFQDKDPNNTNAADFVGTVDWGDGATSAATFAYDAGAGRFNVYGAHQYADATDPAQSGGCAVGALVTDTDGQDLSGGSADRGQCVIGNVAVISGTFSITGESLTFLNSQAIAKDNGSGDYEGPQWVDANGDSVDDRTGTAKGYPVSYLRSRPGNQTFVGIDATFNTSANAGLPDATYLIRGYSMDYNLLQWSGWASVQGTDLVAHLSSRNLPNGFPGNGPFYGSLPSTIDDANLNIWWSITEYPTDGSAAIDLSAPSTQNHLYVTGSTQADGQFETVLDVGCLSAKGYAPDDDPIAPTPGNSAVFGQVWAYFHSREVLSASKQKMFYWGISDSKNLHLAGLLSHREGTCGAWVELFQQALAAQGVTNVETQVISPPRVGNPIPNLVAANFLEVKPTLAAQGGIPLRSAFQNHAIVFYDGVYYDPSYGEPYETPLDWENAALVPAPGNAFTTKYFNPLTLIQVSDTGIQKNPTTVQALWDDPSSPF